MKRLATIRVAVMTAAIFAAVPIRCAAQPACPKVAVESSVEAGQGQLTLADLLGPGSCSQVREAAKQVSLGAAPRPGSVRVFEGRRIRALLEELVNGGTENLREAALMKVPERIVVQRAGTMKSCAEIAGFVASASAAQDQDTGKAPGGRQQNLDCAAARSVPQSAPLELIRTVWNAALQRREFALRCARPEDCVPFLVWTDEREKSGGGLRRAAFPAGSSAALANPGASGGELLIKAGQTAILTWDQGGIRVVLPVTCLDAGGLGQFVRVRFKNAAGTLRAEVLGDGTLRASL
jgi:Chaperone for flagella basal body P-ring formation